MMQGKFTLSEADITVPVLKCSCEEPFCHRSTDLSPTNTHRPKAEPNDSKVKTEGSITVSRMLRDSKAVCLDAPSSWRLPVP